MRHSIMLSLVLLSLPSACQPGATSIALATRTATPTTVATVHPVETIASPLPQPTATAEPKDVPTAVPVSPAATAQSMAASTLSPLVHKSPLDGFPFPVGTSWVYARVEYQQFGTTDIITATTLITETIIDTEGAGSSLSFHHKQTATTLNPPAGWVDDPATDNWERWYRIIGNQVVSYSKPNDEQTRVVAYELPLAVGMTWCPEQPVPAYNPNCSAMGRRSVQSQTSYATPIGTFDECYEITEEYNSGGVTQWFCNGIGVVARKYDHSGSRFGFEDTLISYSRGSAR
jgi:hypothetical protein